MVSNHWKLKEQYPTAGIFVDRQLSSLKKLGIKISTFDVGTQHSPVLIFKKWLRLRRKVRQLRPDLIHAHYGTLVACLAVLAGRPTVISFCGGDLIASATVSHGRRYFGFLLSNLAALGACGVVCKSKELKEALWWRRERAVVIPNGVDLGLFSPGSQQAAREELGWKNGHPIALFNVGHDPEVKGLSLVQAAMTIIRSRIPDAELHIISDVQPVRMPLYYRAADVLLCASKAEGSPNVIKEALACNLPIVSTPVGDVPERLAGVSLSQVVAPHAEAFAEAAVKILLSRQRSNGRQYVSDLDLPEVAKRVIEVYQCIRKDKDS
jgi:glycosyltransferase involved in cell wall biosynthesis